MQLDDLHGWNAKAGATYSGSPRFAVPLATAGLFCSTPGHRKCSHADPRPPAMVIAHVREGVFSAYISALRPTLAPRRGPFFIAGNQTFRPCVNRVIGRTPAGRVLEQGRALRSWLGG